MNHHVKETTLPSRWFSNALLLLTVCVEFIWLISVDCQRLLWFDLIWSSSDFASLGHRGEICYTTGGVKFWTNIMSTCLPSTELLTLWPHLQLFSISPLLQCTPKTGSLLETEWQILEFVNNEIKFSSSKLMMDDKWSFRS